MPTANGEVVFAESPRKAITSLCRLIMRPAWKMVSAFALLLCPPLAQSQEVCGLTSVTESGKLAYPAIARAAHLGGPVVLLVTFQTNGTVAQVKVVSAPPLLNQLLGKVASDYVKSWRANAFSGPRECPIVVEFRMGPETSTPHEASYSRSDLQHVSITAPAPLIIPQYVTRNSLSSRL